MLKIRLKRVGRKKLTTYRIVVMEATTRRDGKPIEDIGSFNPHTDELNLNKFKLLNWIKRGAKPTERITNLVTKELNNN